MPETEECVCVWRGDVRKTYEGTEGPLETYKSVQGGRGVKKLWV